MVDGLPVLGLGAAEQAAYELLIDHPSATLDELRAHWSGAAPLDNLLARLEERALAGSDPGPPERWRPVAPTVAFEALLVKHEDELERARQHVDALEAAYQARPAVRDTASVIEVVTGARAVSQRLLQLQNGARTQVSYLASFFSGVESGPLHRGLTCRAIYDRATIEHPGALATVERLINAGQLARVLPGLPLSLLLADDKIAALPLLRHPAPLEAILIVHPSALLDALVALFDGLWHRALPLHSPAPNPTTRTAPDRLITLLLSGLTDEAIAHQLGLSHRTVQRRVASLMSTLGAHTRFQAGVQAALLRMRRPPTT